MATIRGAYQVRTLDGQSFVFESSHIYRSWSLAKSKLAKGVHPVKALQTAYSQGGLEALSFSILKDVKAVQKTEQKTEGVSEGLEIVRARALTSLVTLAEDWGQLPDDTLKQRASLAANQKDISALTELTLAHMSLYGRKRSKLSSHSNRAYTKSLEIFLSWSASGRGVNLLRPGRNMGALYLNYLEAKGLSTSSVRVRLAAVKNLYKALRWARATEASPFSDAVPASDPTPRHEKRKPYEQEAVKALLNLEPLTPRDKVLVLLGAHAGLRVSEALALTWADVNFTGHELTVRQGKGGKKRSVTLSHALENALDALRNESNEGSSVLGLGIAASVRERLKRLCRRAGVTYMGYHSLRHTAATRHYHQAKDLNKTASFLGHTDIATSQIYAKFAQKEAHSFIRDWD